MYKIYTEKFVVLLPEQTFIPLDPLNVFYQKFKNEVQGIGPENTTIEPVELQDAEGNTMTTEEVAEFVATLP
jgi:hypothetical protein